MDHAYESFLFNFSSSYTGGGLKRLMAYSNWFNEHGGSSFIVNDRLHGIDKQFSVNKYFFIKQNNLSRAINYSSKIKNVIAVIGDIDLYYSYGIPLPYKAGRVNWFHLSNVLPLTQEEVLLPLKRRLEMRLLGFLINRCLKYADVISAESDASIRLFDKIFSKKLFVSVNGSDDEISAYKYGVGVGANKKVEDIAVAVGTYYYKCIDDVAKVYYSLLKSNQSLRLIIIGEKKYIPPYILKDSRVVAKGVISQSEVCDWMRRAKYYITSTIIENSYNAASEGAFLALESFISDIGPHRELLKGVINFERLDNLGTRVAVLHTKSADLNPKNLKSWDQVIREMIDLVHTKPGYLHY
jgi:glycosyltransferase involved in cell wall biosynthesis